MVIDHDQRVHCSSPTLKSNVKCAVRDKIIVRDHKGKLYEAEATFVKTSHSKEAFGIILNQGGSPDEVIQPPIFASVPATQPLCTELRP
jgi:hypothetical protein